MKRRLALNVAAVSVLVGLTLPGCASPRKSFQMSSDSGVPFFGLDFTLPPKFGRGDDASLGRPGQTFADVAAEASCRSPAAP